MLNIFFKILPSQATKQEKSANNMSTYYRYLTVNVNLYIGIKQPNMTDKDRFYKVYSPEKFKLENLEKNSNQEMAFI